ncbi:MAG TPA: low-specificity L-threonine aldolase [Anaerolineae bacterium]|nr:low-specificity L-threonine aldolase [Anaerolineae bacterium]
MDLRSDTVTQPTPEMREAMYRAEVGDDVFSDDPTVNRLEALAAAKLGKEAAVFVASGTLGNLTSLLTHCQRGEEVIVGDQAHIFRYEAGGSSALGGIAQFQIPNHPDGTLPLDRVEAAIRGNDQHEARTRLIALENTHNRCGGTVLPLSYMKQVRELANRHNLRIHLDGARIFNAAVALGVDVKEITQYADSVTFCLSKGLSAPVGSVICGSPEFIAQARRYRKMLGGGMRQAGVLAAAGIVALEKMIDRLAEDHAHARRLAEGLADTPGVAVDLDRVQTNIIYFDLTPEIKVAGEAIVQRLLEQQIKILNPGPARHFRFVTHVWIDRDDVDRVLLAFKAALKS